MTNEIFSFEKGEKVANVPMSVLQESVQVKAANSNNPGPTRPLQSWELIIAIQEMLDKQGITHSLDPIWVEKRSAARILTKEEEADFNETNTPANKWLFDHVVTRINMPVDEGMNPSIGISFNRKGIQVVWGTNVMVCQNMCVFGDNMISTYGFDKTPFGKQMQLLEFWTQKMQERFDNDRQIIHGMQSTGLTPLQVTTLIGDLYQRAIEKAYVAKSKVISPINTATLSQITQEVIVKQDEVATVWDLYNIGTNVIKPGHYNLEDVFPVNQQWSNYLLKEFSLS